MANIFMMNKEIARGMVCFFHQKKHFYLIIMLFFSSFSFIDRRESHVAAGPSGRLGL
jgi:hypothetical protein